MTVPARVQLSRRKGFRLQEHAPGAVVVRRPTRWGNPFTVADALADEPTLTVVEGRRRCAECFDLWLDGEINLTSPVFVERRAWILAHVDELEGLPLACTCPLPAPGEPDWCHGARLIARANPPFAAGRGDLVLSPETWTDFLAELAECGTDFAGRRPLRATQTVRPAGEWAGAL